MNLISGAVEMVKPLVSAAIAFPSPSVKADPSMSML
jgi:hypothetical protein